MRSRENILGVIILALLSFAVAPQTPSTSFKATIEGTVRDASTDQPLQGVEVYVLDPSLRAPRRDSRFAITDAQGDFKIEVSEPGRYRLFPQQEGLVYARPTRLHTFQPGVVLSVGKETVPKIALAMVREGRMAGQILDSSGKALAGITVNLFTRAYADNGKPTWNILGPLAQPAPSRTNDKGEYRFYGLQPGDYILGVQVPIAAPSRYHPGVEDLSRAVPIRVARGEETRVAPMRAEPPTKTVQVRFRFEDPERKFVNKGLTTPAGGFFGFFSGFGSSSQRENAIELAMARGHYDLLLVASSRTNDLLFAPVTIDVASEDIQSDVRFNAGFRVTGSITLQDSSGKNLNATEITCGLYSTSESATAQSGTPGCIGGQFSPAHYTLDVSRVLPDAYVASAKSGDRDVLAEGLRIERDTPLDIVLSTPGAVIEGRVMNSKGEHLSHAVVALVPDAPLRTAGPRYRSDTTTFDGSFELRGIAPGAYRLYAWSDLPGSAYRNAEFMAKYENKGVPVRIDIAKRLSIDLTALD